MQNLFPYVLSIAGFDPSAGAGILADIKTFEAYHTYGFGVNTANTIQNDQEFLSVEWVNPDVIFSQVNVLFKRFEINWVKIGIIENADILLDTIKNILKHNKSAKIIWDPVIKSSSGFTFHNNFNSSVLEKVLKSIYLITPNIPEASMLFPDFKDLTKFQNYLKENKYCNVLLKGGHSTDKFANDILFTRKNNFVITGKKYPAYTKHGTGCIFSSAVLASLANNRDLITSCKNAKTYVEIFLTSNNSLLGFHQ